MSAITFEQFKRAIDAIDAHERLLGAIREAFKAAGDDPPPSLGCDGILCELLRQLAERCDDPEEEFGGTMVGYMLYEGRKHGGRCVGADGIEMDVNSPEALWEWWRLTRSGPFSA